MLQMEDYQGTKFRRQIERFLQLLSVVKSAHLQSGACMFCLQASHRLEKYLNIQECLEKSLKIKFALKST